MPLALARCALAQTTSGRLYFVVRASSRFGLRLEPRLKGGASCSNPGSAALSRSPRDRWSRSRCVSATGCLNPLRTGPLFNVADHAPYLGGQVGLRAGVHMWTVAVEKWAQRCADIARSGAPAAAAAELYKTRALPTLLYLAQFSPLPGGFEKREAHRLAGARRPSLWVRSRARCGGQCSSCRFDLPFFP